MLVGEGGIDEGARRGAVRNRSAYGASDVLASEENAVVQFVIQCSPIWTLIPLGNTDGTLGRKKAVVGVEMGSSV